MKRSMTTPMLTGDDLEQHDLSVEEADNIEWEESGDDHEKAQSAYPVV